MAGDLRTALQGVREAARCLELEGRFRGEIDAGATINVVLAPALLTLQTVVINALADHPAARLAVVQALGSMSAGPPMLEHDGG